VITKIFKHPLLQISRQNWLWTQATFLWNAGSQLHNDKMSLSTKSVLMNLKTP